MTCQRCGAADATIPFVEYGSEIAKPVTYCDRCFIIVVFDKVADARMQLDYAYMYLDKAMRIMAKERIEKQPRGKIKGMTITVNNIENKLTIVGLIENRMDVSVIHKPMHEPKVFDFKNSDLKALRQIKVGRSYVALVETEDGVIVRVGPYRLKKFNPENPTEDLELSIP